jgi:hypothetical protein
MAVLQMLQIGLSRSAFTDVHVGRITAVLVRDRGRSSGAQRWCQSPSRSKLISSEDDHVHDIGLWPRPAHQQRTGFQPMAGRNHGVLPETQLLCSHTLNGKPCYAFAVLLLQQRSAWATLVREQGVLTRFMSPHLVRTTSQCTKHADMSPSISACQHSSPSLPSAPLNTTIQYDMPSTLHGTATRSAGIWSCPNPPGHLALEAARLTRWGHAPCQGAACRVFWRTGFLTSSQGSWSLLCQRTRSASAHALLCPYSIQALARETCIHAQAHPQPTSQPEAAAGGGAPRGALSILRTTGCLRICYSACGRDNERCNTHHLPAAPRKTTARSSCCHPPPKNLLSCTMSATVCSCQFTPACLMPIHSARICLPPCHRKA